MRFLIGDNPRERRVDAHISDMITGMSFEYIIYCIRFSTKTKSCRLNDVVGITFTCISHILGKTNNLKWYNDDVYP